MTILFIQPAVGHKVGGATYPKTWIMEPLALAVLSALTPKGIERLFMDDRLNEVDYAAEADVVAIPVECYTAARSYEIADRFRARGITVLLGGFHTTLNPEEATEHADAIVCGDAETVWDEVLSDLCSHSLKRKYVGRGGVFCPLPDRTLFRGRPYGMANLVETARGCMFACEFCSVTKFFNRRYTPRPLDDVIAEVRSLKKDYLFFVDDNLAMDVPRLKELCRRMIPLKKKWMGQLSIHTANDDELLALMAESGCAGVLIGFESLDADTLSVMGKRVNTANADYARAIANLRRYHLSIYATFVFGYDNDTEETFRRTYDFAMESRFFFAAFNHLVPFPGTDVHARFVREGRMLHEKWWLDPSVGFGDVVFRPKNFTPEKLAEMCQTYRLKYYSLPSILKRGMDVKANTHGLVKALFFYYSNFSQKLEILRRRGLPNGGEP
ncbi:MAG: B12-binding domain-containing radical SAM protein [Kiritimatiellae bacterium]|nr:B12-binding domain-containing radical SAM protein [Kiritimatiellia bacterium]